MSDSAVVFEYEWQFIVSPLFVAWPKSCWVYSGWYSILELRLLMFLPNFQQPWEHRRPRSNDINEGKDGWRDGNQVMIRFPSYLIGLRLMVKYLSGFLEKKARAKKKYSSILKESLKGNKELETCLLVAKSVWGYSTKRERECERGLPFSSYKSIKGTWE